MEEGIFALGQIYNNQIVEIFSQIEEKVISFNDKTTKSNLEEFGKVLELLPDIFSKLENNYYVVSYNELAFYYKEQYDSLIKIFDKFNNKTSRKIYDNAILIRSLKAKLAEAENLSNKNNAMWSTLLASIENLRGSKAEKPNEDIAKKFDEYEAKKNLDKALYELEKAKNKLLKLENKELMLENEELTLKNKGLSQACVPAVAFDNQPTFGYFYSHRSSPKREKTNNNNNNNNNQSLRQELLDNNSNLEIENTYESKIINVKKDIADKKKRASEDITFYTARVKACEEDYKKFLIVSNVRKIPKSISLRNC